MGRKTQNSSRRRKGKDKKREKFEKRGKYNAKSIRIQLALKKNIKKQETKIKNKKTDLKYCSKSI